MGSSEAHAGGTHLVRRRKQLAEGLEIIEREGLIVEAEDRLPDLGRRELETREHDADVVGSR